MGRPSLYSDDLAARICARLAEGQSLRAICRDPEMPCTSSVMTWLANTKHVGFLDQYAQSREVGLDAMADEILEIADQPLPRLKDGRIDSGKVQEKRLQIDTRKWILSKQLAKKYGDKLDLAHGGAISLTVITGVPHAEEPSVADD